ncbi:MAG: DUF3108 domain-containing protein [Anaeromyxobacter sp.]
MRMGVSSISVGNADGGLVPVELWAKSTGVVGLYHLRQKLVSWIDPVTGLPGNSVIQGEEGSYRHTDTTKVDRATGQATVHEVGKHDNTYQVEVPKDALDFVALVFRLRTLPLEPGTKHEFQVLSGRKVNKIVAEAMGRETLDTRIGKLPAIRVRIPTGFSGKFSEKNPTEVWFSDDARRVILRITTDFAVGHASANITEYRPGVAPAPDPAGGEAGATTTESGGTGG